MKKITKVIDNTCISNLKAFFTQKEENFKNYVNDFKNEYSYLLKSFAILFVIFLIAIYPIIRANYNYIDDTGRAARGYREFSVWSRYTSEFLSIFIHSNKYLTDVSPLTQIIAVVFLSLSGIIILHLFNNKKENKKINFINILAVIPIGLSPYFLECISYKYDSPYMALSILASIFPFIFCNKGKIKFGIMTFIGTIIMCTTYQPASGIIPLVTIFYAFKLWNNKETKKAIQFILTAGIGYALGLIIFKIFIMAPINDYASNSMVSLKELIPAAFTNLKKYYEYIITDFRKSWICLIVIIIIGYIIANIQRSKQNKILAALLSILLLIISGIITFGLYIILEKPLFQPRAMYGFGVLIALIAVNSVNYSRQYISKLSVVLLVWSFFVFTFTYGNFLGEQKRYVDFRVQQVVNGLSEVEIMQNDTKKNIVITGNAGSSPCIENLPVKYKNLINRLIPQTFAGDWSWDYAYFTLYFKLNNIEVVKPEQLPENLITVKTTSYYDIQTNNVDYIIINLK